MDSEIYDELLSDYPDFGTPENTSFSFAENYSTQSDGAAIGAPSGLPVDYSAAFTILERKIWVTKDSVSWRIMRYNLCAVISG